MTGLIIEGGARRGIFTAGITDCLLENKIHFDYVAGVWRELRSPLILPQNRKVVPAGLLCPTEQAIFRFSVFFQWILTI